MYQIVLCSPPPLHTHTHTQFGAIILHIYNHGQDSTQSLPCQQQAPRLLCRDQQRRLPDDCDGGCTCATEKAPSFIKVFGRTHTVSFLAGICVAVGGHTVHVGGVTAGT